MNVHSRHPNARSLQIASTVGDNFHGPIGMIAIRACRQDANAGEGPGEGDQGCPPGVHPQVHPDSAPRLQP